MPSEQVIHWHPGPESGKVLRRLYRARARKPILGGLVLTYLGMVFIPPEGETLFALKALPIHLMVVVFWVVAYWYFGSKRFAPTRCTIVRSVPPSLVVDGWKTDRLKCRFVADCGDQVVASLDGFMLGYISIPKELLGEFDVVSDGDLQNRRHEPVQ